MTPEEAIDLLVASRDACIRPRDKSATGVLRESGEVALSDDVQLTMVSEGPPVSIITNPQVKGLLRSAAPMANGCRLREVGQICD